MTNFDLDNFFRALRNLSLSEREKRNMRIALVAHMGEHPLRASVPVSAKVQKYFSDMLNSRTLSTHPVFAACVLVLVVGVGTSYAAQFSLPGEPLYAIKTSITEPLEGALALSPAAQTEWNAELTFRRLQEAEALAAQGDLNPVANAEIENRLSLSLNKFSSSVQLLEEHDDLKAASAQSDLEASLNAHETVLASLPATAQNETTHLAAFVQKHVGKLSKKRVATEAALTSINSPQVKSAALKTKQSAEDAIGEMQVSAEAADVLAASSSLMIATEAERDVRAGDEEARRGKWGNAYNAFQDAARKAKETKSSIDTRAWLSARFGVGFNALSTTTASLNALEVFDADKSGSDSDNSGKGGSSDKDDH